MEKEAKKPLVKARLDILKSLGVRVELHSDDHGYKGMYTKVIAYTS